MSHKVLLTQREAKSLASLIFLRALTIRWYNFHLCVGSKSVFCGKSSTIKYFVVKVLSNIRFKIRTNIFKIESFTMEEKLIESMKMHSCLYDKSSVLFRNKYLKDRAWQAVAISTGVSEEHCKSRWKSLRDRFVREMSASKVKSGAAAGEKTEWCYMEAMRFLTKHVSPRKTTSNFDWISNEQQCCSQAPHASQNEDDVELEPSEFISEDTMSSAKSSKRQRVGNESRERFERLCGTIEAVIASKTEKVPSKNNAFLQMLDECLKRKPEDVQDRLKIELLAYVHNAS